MYEAFISSLWFQRLLISYGDAFSFTSSCSDLLRHLCDVIMSRHVQSSERSAESVFIDC